MWHGTRPSMRRGMRLTGLAGVLVGLTALPVSPASDGEPQGPVRFERDVQPIFTANCAGCHGADHPKAGLDLRTVASTLRGGKSGPALRPSDPDGSLLLERIAQGEMPPGKARKLSHDDVETVRAWIRGGARTDHPSIGGPATASPVRDEDRRFWSFRPLRRPLVPMASHADRIRSPVDRFLLARLDSKGLSFSPDADPTTLVRRTYLDLVGLPPSLEEVDSFLADGQPGAFERLVDRLLASPHHGERWGRHWLDVAGYVDTVGFDTDATNIILSEGKWRYRDYVIRAFNADRPYDRFLTEQLAGDELQDWRKAERFTPEMREALIATGYLRTARDLTHEDVGVIPQNFFGIVHDTIEIVGTGLLGLTVNCARCHSHKFDPIPQEDYYRLMAIFTPAYNPKAWLPVIPTETRSRDRGLPDVSPAEMAELERHNAGVDRRLKELRDRLNELRRPHSDRLFETRLAALPAAIRAGARQAIGTPADKRDEQQKELIRKYGAALTVKPDEVSASLSPTEREAVKAIEARIIATGSSRRAFGKIQVLYDVGTPPRTHLLVRGNEQSPGPEVQPGFLRVLCRSDARAIVASPPPHDGTTGRRLALAHWLTDPESPASALVARVMVNRIWKHLFGQGLVPTPDNFGLQGQPPTHPELLEWLSCELVEGGWRIKPMIRIIMASTAYRQASRRPDGSAPSQTDPESVDPGNELLWRMRLRRLESEVVRDAILAISGDLNRTAGGPPVPIIARPDGLVEVAKDRLADPTDRYRRSIYLTTRRAYNDSLLTAFDQPLVATNCLKRFVSAVPSQSLLMLNDAFLAEQAEHFARRVERLSSSSPDRKIELAFRLALVRRPGAVEAETCRELLVSGERLFLEQGLTRAAAAHRALVQLCQVLFNTSEFLFAE
jgi:mono/diheme cytochrome c family protein